MAALAGLCFVPDLAVVLPGRTKPNLLFCCWLCARVMGFGNRSTVGTERKDHLSSALVSGEEHLGI